MKSIRKFFIFAWLCLLIAVSPARAQVFLQEPYGPQSQNSLEDDWVFEINQAADVSAYDHRQLMVASGCDVNGDGFDDVLVGDRDYDYMYARDDNGSAWLFYGASAGLPSSPAHTFAPPYINYYGFFGEQVVCAGDVNKDGYDDLLIGMDNYDSVYSDEGAVFVWYGSANGPQNNYDWMARGNATYAHFGISADAAGDVNGDGYDDIIVGAWRYDSNYISHAYVWYGSAAGLGANGTPANADWIAADPYPGVPSGNGFGRIVRGIGDVNGDGYDDVLVGAHAYDGGVTDQGAVFVWYGSASGLGPNGTLANADWMAVSAQGLSRFGLSATGPGDLNKDGYDDLAVGAYYYDHPEANEGAVFVWYGSASGLGPNGNPGNAGWMAESDITSIFGFSVRPAGDFNGDGYADLLITAPSYPVESDGGTLSGAGAWFIWFGAENGLGPNGTPANADKEGLGDQTGGHLGYDDSASGDVNGDGFSDIFVAAYTYDQGQTDEGVVFGYYSPFMRLYLPVILRPAP